MSIDYKLIGSRIKKHRLLMGKTQEQFAEYLDVTVGYVSQMERGITKISLDRLSTIAEYLNCPMTDLISDVSTHDKNYMTSEFLDSYLQLTPKEKSIVSNLIKAYIEQKKDCH